MTHTPNPPRERIPLAGGWSFDFSRNGYAVLRRPDGTHADVPAWGKEDAVAFAAALNPLPAGMAEVEAAVDLLRVAAYHTGFNLAVHGLNTEKEQTRARTALLDLIRPLFPPAPDMAEVEAAVDAYGRAERSFQAAFGEDVTESEMGSFRFEVIEARTALLDIIARHRSAPGTPAIPAGWKLVPIEPTEEMIHVMRFGECDAKRIKIGQEPEIEVTPWPRFGPDLARRAYVSALAAVPPTPTPDVASNPGKVEGAGADEALIQARADVWERAAKVVEGMEWIGRSMPGEIATALRAAAKAEEAGS